MSHDLNAELPLYQCHKKVRALKIQEVTLHDPAGSHPPVEFAGGFMHFEDKGFGCRAFDADFWNKHHPEKGGYFVVYEDGYTSYSPAKAFEEGYTQLIPYTGPDAYKLRVRMEHDALENNIDRLETFLGTSGPPDCELKLNDVKLLSLQLDAMRLYAHILSQRLATF